MLRELIATGNTADDAIEKACLELGVARDEAEFEILELPKKGLFGLMKTPAKVRVYFEVPDEPKPQSQSQPQAQARRKPSDAPPPRKAAFAAASVKAAVPVAEAGEKPKIAAEYLKTVLTEMGVGPDLTIEVKETETGAELILEAEEIGVAIGRRGQTMDALQYLSGLVANRSDGAYYRITLDSGNYREKRERTLQSLAKKIALQVVKTGRSTTLEPMNPYERRVIHAAVQQIDGASSTSIGEEPNRRVVINAENGRQAQPQRDRADRPQRSGDSRPPREGGRGDRGPRGGSGRGGDRRGGGRDSGRDRFDRKKAPSYEPTQIREKPPQEAKDTPLYSKIEID